MFKKNYYLIKIIKQSNHLFKLKQFEHSFGPLQM